MNIVAVRLTVGLNVTPYGVLNTDGPVLWVSQ